MSQAVTITVTNSASSQVVPECRVQVCSDEAGTTLLFEEYTTTAGEAAFSLDAGTYYVFCRKTGYRFDNPESATVVAAPLAVAVDAEPLSALDNTITDICNGALDLIGAGMENVEKLDSFENDDNATADWFRENYERCRRKALLRHEWNEAIAYPPGTDSGGDVEAVDHGPYEYAYAMPQTFTENGVTTGVLQTLGIVDDSHNPLDFQPLHWYVLCNVAAENFYWKLLLDLDYGFSQGLQDAIEYELAIRAATKFLKGKRGDEKRATLLQEYNQMALPVARGQNQAGRFDKHNNGRFPRWIDIR